MRLSKKQKDALLSDAIYLIERIDQLLSDVDKQLSEGGGLA